MVAYINKLGGTHSAEMCALLWKIMTWCHRYHITLKARHIPGRLNVMADLLSRSNQVQTDLPEVVHTSCRLICHSPEPQAPTVHVSYPRPQGLGHRCSKHRLDQPHGLCLPSYGSPSQGDPKDQAMPLPDHRDSPRLARDALVWDLVQLSTEIPLQLPVSTTLLKQSHKYMFHNNPQLLNLHAWCLGADNSKNKASLWRWQRELLPLSGHQQGPSTSQSGPYLKNGAEKIRWISPLHL